MRECVVYWYSTKEEVQSVNFPRCIKQFPHGSGWNVVHRYPDYVIDYAQRPPAVQGTTCGRSGQQASEEGEEEE